jgi:hypothetical protein
MTTAPMNYAVQKGIFKKYGLDVTLAYIDAGTTLSQAVVGGSVGIAQNGYSPAAAAAVAGADVVFIGGISNQLPFQLVVKGNIKSAADLKGKKLAISRFGASSDIAATYALRHLGTEAHRRGDPAIGRRGHPHRPRCSPVRLTPRSSNIRVPASSRKRASAFSSIVSTSRRITPTPPMSLRAPS